MLSFCSIRLRTFYLAIIASASVLVWVTSRQHAPKLLYPWEAQKADEVVIERWRIGSREETVSHNDTVQKELMRLQKLVMTMKESMGNQTRPTEEHREHQKCSKTLSSLIKYSKWFRERYRPDVKLFLDEDDTRHYDNLSSNTLPFGFKGQNKTVLNQMLLHENFTNPSIHKKKAGSKTGCVRCAVVGCGGILNGSGAGDEIDSHDYVFRVNRALTKGRFANDVGKRTTFYTFFPESQNIQDVEDKNVLLFFTMFKKYDVEYGLNMIKDVPPPPYISRGKEHLIRKPASDPRRLKIVHPDFFKYVFHTYLDDKSARPTTGALVVGLALHICDEVTIYGFGYDPRFTMHYYDTKFVTHTQASTGSHDVDNERMLWMKLHDEGAIRLFKRDV